MKRLALVALAVAAAACTQRTQLLAGDAGAACSGTGPLIALGGACAPALAADTFRYAVCTCQSLVLSGNLVTEGDGPPMMQGPGMFPAAAVGSDGSVQIGGEAQIAGTISAGAAMSFSQPASVFANLHSGGSVSATHLLAVGGDAFIAGDVLGHVAIGGTLHVAPDSNVGSSVSAHDIAREIVSGDTPCGCDSPALDVAALVAAARDANSDDSIALDPADANPTTIDLPCGSYYVTSLNTPGELDVAVHGRAALFVGGDVTLGAGLRVTLDVDAELDLVIAGSLTVSGGSAGGDDATRVRVWLGGDTVSLANGATLALALYAPRATLSDDSSLDLSGALFVSSLALPGDLTARYDTRLLQWSSECDGAQPVPPVQ